MEADMLRRKLEAIGLVVVTCALMSAAAMAEGRDGAYRGTMVCTKLSSSQFILRAPLDITISGKAVVASEIATGNIADDGPISFNSNWHGGASSFAGSYSGTIVDKTGTLTGTQNWTTVTGKETRNCTAAVVLTGL
jgi:hypothetical protein